MCPACLSTTLALIAAGATTTGGLAAAVVAGVRAKRAPTHSADQALETVTDVTIERSE